MTFTRIFTDESDHLEVRFEAESREQALKNPNAQKGTLEDTQSKCSISLKHEDFIAIMEKESGKPGERLTLTIKDSSFLFFGIGIAGSSRSEDRIIPGDLSPLAPLLKDCPSAAKTGRQ